MTKRIQCIGTDMLSCIGSPTTNVYTTAKFSIFPAKIVAFFIYDILTTQRRKYVIFSNPVFFSGFYIGTQVIKSSGWMAFCMYTVEIHFKISTNEHYAVFTHHIMLNLASKSSQTAQSH
jgi:hypothetical protein